MSSSKKYTFKGTQSIRTSIVVNDKPVDIDLHEGHTYELPDNAYIRGLVGKGLLQAVKTPTVPPSNSTDKDK